MTNVTFWRVLLTCVLLLVWLRPAAAQDGALAPDDYAEAMRLMTAGQHAEAAAVLARIVEASPEHAGALLDLAIVQCTLGHAATATHLLDTMTARFVPPPAIAAVITALRARGCAAAAPAAGGSWTLALAHGIDSNASQGTRVDTLVLDGLGGIELLLAPEYLPRADRFTLLTAEYAHALPYPGLRGFAQIQARVHETLGQYDTTTLLVGGDVPWRLGNWRGHVAATFGTLLLNDQLYHRQTRLQWHGGLPLFLPAHLRVSATADLTHTRYPALTNFDGTIGEAGGMLEWRINRALVRAMVAAAADRATDARPGGDRTGWHAKAQLRFPVWGGGHGELSASRRVWRGARAYAPGLIDRTRDQTTDTLGGVVSFPLTADQSLFVELRSVWNRESIPVFGHDGQQLMLGWEWRSR